MLLIIWQEHMKCVTYFCKWAYLWNHIVAYFISRYFAMFFSIDFNQGTSIFSFLYSFFFFFRNHFYKGVCSLSVSFYEGRVTYENDQNLKATKLGLWLLGTKENEEETTLSIRVCSTCVMSSFFILFQVASNLN